MKNLSIYLFALMIMLALLPVKAQLKSYDLSTYKLPEMTRNSLDMRFNLQESSVRMDYGPRSRYSNGGYSSDYAPYYLLDESSINGSIGFSFRSFVNKVDLQQSIISDVNLPLYWSDKKYNAGFEYVETTVNPSISWEFMNRKFSKGDTFRETVIDLEYTRVYTKHREYKYSEEGFNSKSVDNNLKIRIPLKVGTGRIEQVQYARQAIFILEDLQQKGRISTEISTDQISRFADHISQLQKKRFFDFRIYRSEVIEALDSFLVAENLATETDAVYFTSLVDMWSFGNKQVRESGRSFGVAFVPGFFRCDNKDESTTVTVSSNPGSSYLDIATGLTFEVGPEFILESPLSQKVQFSFAADAKFGLVWMNFKHSEEEIFTSRTESEYKSNDMYMPNLQISINQSIGYFPSTRTDFTLGNDISFLKFFDFDEKPDAFVNETLENGILGNINFKMNYYFTPRVTLNLSARMSYLNINNSPSYTHSFNYLLDSGFPMDMYNDMMKDANVTMNFNYYFVAVLRYAIF